MPPAPMPPQCIIHPGKCCCGIGPFCAGLCDGCPPSCCLTRCACLRCELGYCSPTCGISPHCMWNCPLLGCCIHPNPCPLSCMTGICCCTGELEANGCCGISCKCCESGCCASVCNCSKNCCAKCDNCKPCMECDAECMADCCTLKLCFDVCMPGLCPFKCCTIPGCACGPCGCKDGCPISCDVNTCCGLCKPMGCELGCLCHITCLQCPLCCPEIACLKNETVTCESVTLAGGACADVHLDASVKAPGMKVEASVKK